MKFLAFFVSPFLVGDAMLFNTLFFGFIFRLNVVSKMYMNSLYGDTSEGTF